MALSPSDAVALAREDGWCELVLSAPPVMRAALVASLLVGRAAGFDSASPPPPRRALQRAALARPPLAPFGRALTEAADDDDVLAPPDAAPRSAAEAAHRAEVDAAIALYWNGRDGHCTTDEEDLFVDAASRLDGPGRVRGGASTYGEVTARGARELAALFGIDAADAAAADAAEPLAFVDLGSGVGKLAAQIYLEYGGVRRSRGVELAPSRHKRARAAWSMLRAVGDARRLRAEARALLPRGAAAAADDDDDDGLEFIEGDLLTADLADATHVYVASLCFDDALLARLSERLSTPGVAPRLRALATLRAFPRGFAPAALPWRETRRIEMSWSRHGSGTPTHFYYCDQRPGTTDDEAVIEERLGRALQFETKAPLS